MTGRLLTALPAIIAAEAQYVVHGEQATLFEIPGTDGVAGQISTQEMTRVYERTFVRSARTRGIYGTIKATPRNDICPLCSQRTVSQLDHYLPKAEHPNVAVTPLNLVPSCGECNHIKLALEAGQAAEQVFHPYFEDADDGRWLFATVQETAPATLVFDALPPAGWDVIKQRRIVAHFETFQLAELYATHSAVELEDIKVELRTMAQAGISAAGIQAELRKRADSRAAAHGNSWRRATYEALSESEWFCAGGFG
ncbi:MULTISPECIES: hypothetical protein [Hyphobacterium]|uniref:HNH endonuclease n=1 Tax=Hyphobacterium vulgare TaxID=1736751 RepID=A0ABV6ZSS1_9PROT